MTELLAQVETNVFARGLLLPGSSVLVGVSGGADSVVLLHLLHRLAPSYRWRLVVAHFNHQLRGRSSDADQRFVGALAQRLGLPFATARGEVRAVAGEEGWSIEMAARRLRHEFFASAAKRTRCRTLALAHHADDQVELFFLRLLRGAGSEGLAGMRWSNPAPADPRLQIIRPLLNVPRSDLLAFLRRQRIAHREDASNAHPDHLRNRLRHHLLPALTRSYQPALREIVVRQMDLLGAESACLEQWTRDWLAARTSAPFDTLPVALQRRVLQRQLIELNREPTFELVEQLRARPTEPVTVAPALAVMRQANGRLKTVSSSAPQFSSRSQRLGLDARHGQGEFSGLSLEWDIVERAGKVLPPRRPEVEWFDADRVGKEIILRHWRRGDRFQPIGLARPAKLQDLFTNARVLRAERHRRILATTAAGEIWWVEGLRIGDRFKLTAETRRRLRWQWTRSR